jgi:hypothetical protein
VVVDADFSSDDIHVRVAAILSDVDVYNFELDSDGAG